MGASAADQAAGHASPQRCFLTSEMIFASSGVYPRPASDLVHRSCTSDN